MKLYCSNVILILFTIFPLNCDVVLTKSDVCWWCRAFISGTYRTVCWSGSIRVWHRGSTPFTPASVDTMRISSLAEVKVLLFIPQLRSSGAFPVNLTQSCCVSQIIRFIFGTSAASCRSWSWRDTHAQWTASAGTPVFPVLWPALLTTAQSVSGDPHPSWTHKSWTASMVQTCSPNHRTNRKCNNPES